VCGCGGRPQHHVKRAWLGYPIHPAVGPSPRTGPEKIHRRHVTPTALPPTTCVLGPQLAVCSKQAAPVDADDFRGAEPDEGAGGTRQYKRPAGQLPTGSRAIFFLCEASTVVSHVLRSTVLCTASKSNPLAFFFTTR
jgi:hypothetical protein